MSLISEKVNTVQESSIGVVKSAFNTRFTNLEALNGYKVISGSVEPRAAGATYLVVDDNGDPVQLPPNSLPYKFFFYPTELLDGPNNGMGIGPLLFSDEMMSTFYDPFGWYAPMSQINPKGCSVTALVFFPPKAVLSNYNGYPYVGVKVYGGLDPITAGKVKVDLYYNTFY